MTEDFLDMMAWRSRDRTREAKAKISLPALLDLAKSTPEPAPLLMNGFDLIAEVKLRSPAAGRLKGDDEDVGARVMRYANAGAAAISVLTEPSRFDGAMSHLELAAHALQPLHVPAMRKDFLVDPYQVIEARAASAGGVLIILRMLEREQLESLIEQALTLNLFALLEAFDEKDIELSHELAEKYAKVANADGERVRLLVGVNCRDLVTLKVVPGRLEDMAKLLPATLPRVAESGVGSADDAARVAAAGYELALVGSALMTAADPEKAVADMLSSGRKARGR
jgi:indole-3-glycerol phosphate synthase